MLPNELLLQVLHFVDYRTLVLAKLAGAALLRVVTKYAAELARRRSFQVAFYAKWVTYGEVTLRARRSVHYEPGNQASLVAACQKLDVVIGPHAVAKLMFDDNTWNMPGVGVIFEAAPPLKYAEDVGLNSTAGSTTVLSSDAFVRSFASIKSLRLWLAYDVFDRFSWAFLCEESACGLRLLKVSCKDSWAARADIHSAVEEIFRCCGTLPRLHDGEALVLDFF
ncbi:hypothetical protein AAVH_18315 [Aphelenchoides avenae]|nr:hypothetical protein AAVH_18315 [Aphelenchus avenae]